MELRTWTRAACLAALLLAAACGGDDEPDRSWSVRGQVAKVFDGGRSLSIQHEKIPDFMDAMTMTFPVTEASQASSLRPGDKIRFQLEISGGSIAIGAIEALPPDTVLELGGGG